MLATGQIDAERKHWSVSKFETSFYKSSSNHRMSDHFRAPLSTQAEWPGQHTVPPPISGLSSSPYSFDTDPEGGSGPRVQARQSNDTKPWQVDVEEDPGVLGQPESLPASDQARLSLGSDTLTTISRSSTGSTIARSQPNENEQDGMKEEEDEDLDYEDMLDAEGDISEAHMSPAERSAARRKMKRFRWAKSPAGEDRLELTNNAQAHASANPVSHE